MCPSRTLTVAALLGVLLGGPALVGCGALTAEDPVSGAGGGAGSGSGGTADDDDRDDEDAPDLDQDGRPDGDGGPVAPGGGGGGGGGAPAPEPSDGPAIEIVGLEQAPAAGGSAATSLTLVSRPAALDDLLEPLTDPALSMAVRRRVGEASMSGAPYAAVVSVGCDVPPGIDVYPVRGGWGVAAKPVYDPTPECFAPITTVAVVAITGG